mgnify:FL=1
MCIRDRTYTSNGTGSPAIYSTADIAVNEATLAANGSEAICIEGLNSIHLYDSDLTGNMSDDSRNDCTWNVILYQSMSGDSEVGNSTFEMDGGSLNAKNGGMFYTTNTESTITLDDVDVSLLKIAVRLAEHIVGLLQEPPYQIPRAGHGRVNHHHKILNPAHFFGFQRLH